MKTTALLVLAAMAGLTAHAGEPQSNGYQTVTVCTEGGIGIGVTPLAQLIASKMFAEIGVTIHWHPGLQGCPTLGILISLGDQTPETLHPGVLAYALPFEGTHIRIFYDRIVANYDQRLLSSVLAHVLVHEITHILQGDSGHSESGVMKAHWSGSDLSQMARKPLTFTSEDIRLIDRGLAARTARAASLRPAE
jgi:hypothetical protein